MRRDTREGPARKVRFAVAGLGYIAQSAVLPAFAHAPNAELVALISDDPEKRRRLGERYAVGDTADYAGYEECLRRARADAVYVALPNSLHREFAVRAFAAGVHVLCEKPMAVTEEDCLEMIGAARRQRRRLMVAYRLHFEKANLEAIALVRQGKLGDPRLFGSAFTMPVKDPGNVRLRWDLGGGTLYDLGVYGVNAARSLFGSEPVEVSAFTAVGGDVRFSEVEEMTASLLRFPGERLAHIAASFGAVPRSYYEVVGTEGRLRLEGAYSYDAPMRLTVSRADGKTESRSYRARDQFGPELVYFADCISKDVAPEPSGEEGLADVRVVEALYHAAAGGRSVCLREFRRSQHPEPEQEIHKPKVRRRPQLVHAASPAGT